MNANFVLPDYGVQDFGDKSTTSMLHPLKRKTWPKLLTNLNILIETGKPLSGIGKSNQARKVIKRKP